MSTKFVQEACIGYNSGSIISLGIADIRHHVSSEDVEMSDLSEETKDNI
jgi:hypothetical protein